MANELMEQVKQAEHAAEETHAQAAQEARDMIQAVEEASLASQRDAQAQTRERVARLLDEARAGIEQEIATQQEKEARQRAAQREAALARVDQAADWIFERIMTHGNR